MNIFRADLNLLDFTLDSLDNYVCFSFYPIYFEAFSSYSLCFSAQYMQITSVSLPNVWYISCIV